jgi:hypothetical protein
MLVRLAAGLALALVLWWAFRLSMGLRWSKVQRERLREEEAGRGRIVAELPLPEGMAFFVEDAAGFRWGGDAIARGAVCGARLLLNSAVVASVERPGAVLPPPPAPEDEPGRERWEVMAYLDGGAARTVRCGSVREGISRQAARAVFDALRAACAAAPEEERA